MSEICFVLYKLTVIVAAGVSGGGAGFSSQLALL